MSSKRRRQQNLGERIATLQHAQTSRKSDKRQSGGQPLFLPGFGGTRRFPDASSRETKESSGKDLYNRLDSPSWARWSEASFSIANDKEEKENSEKEAQSEAFKSAVATALGLPLSPASGEHQNGHRRQRSSVGSDVAHSDASISVNGKIDRFLSGVSKILPPDGASTNEKFELHRIVDMATKSMSRNNREQSNSKNTCTMRQAATRLDRPTTEERDLWQEAMNSNALDTDDPVHRELDAPVRNETPTTKSKRPQSRRRAVDGPDSGFQSVPNETNQGHQNAYYQQRSGGRLGIDERIDVFAPEVDSRRQDDENLEPLRRPRRLSSDLDDVESTYTDKGQTLAGSSADQKHRQPNELDRIRSDRAIMKERNQKNHDKSLGKASLRELVKSASKSGGTKTKAKPSVVCVRTMGEFELFESPTFFSEDNLQSDYHMNNPHLKGCDPGASPFRRQRQETETEEIDRLLAALEPYSKPDRPPNTYDSKILSPNPRDRVGKGTSQQFKSFSSHPRNASSDIPGLELSAPLEDDLNESLKNAAFAMFDEGNTEITSPLLLPPPPPPPPTKSTVDTERRSVLRGASNKNTAVSNGTKQRKVVNTLWSINEREDLDPVLGPFVREEESLVSAESKIDQHAMDKPKSPARRLVSAFCNPVPNSQVVDYIDDDRSEWFAKLEQNEGEIHDAFRNLDATGKSAHLFQKVHRRYRNSNTTVQSEVPLQHSEAKEIDRACRILEPIATGNWTNEVQMASQLTARSGNTTRVALSPTFAKNPTNVAHSDWDLDGSATARFDTYENLDNQLGMDDVGAVGQDNRNNHGNNKAEESMSLYAARHHGRRSTTILNKDPELSKASKGRYSSAIADFREKSRLVSTAKSAPSMQKETTNFRSSTPESLGGRREDTFVAAESLEKRAYASDSIRKYWRDYSTVRLRGSFDSISISSQKTGSGSDHDHSAFQKHASEEISRNTSKTEACTISASLTSSGSALTHGSEVIDHEAVSDRTSEQPKLYVLGNRLESTTVGPAVYRTSSENHTGTTVRPVETERDFVHHASDSQKLYDSESVFGRNGYNSSSRTYIRPFESEPVLNGILREADELPTYRHSYDVQSESVGNNLQNIGSREAADPRSPRIVSKNQRKHADLKKDIMRAKAATRGKAHIDRKYPVSDGTKPRKAYPKPKSTIDPPSSTGVYNYNSGLNEMEHEPVKVEPVGMSLDHRSYTAASHTERTNRATLGARPEPPGHDEGVVYNESVLSYGRFQSAYDLTAAESLDSNGAVMEVEDVDQIDYRPKTFNRGSFDTVSSKSEEVEQKIKEDHGKRQTRHYTNSAKMDRNGDTRGRRPFSSYYERELYSPIRSSGMRTMNPMLSSRTESEDEESEFSGKGGSIKKTDSTETEANPACSIVCGGIDFTSMFCGFCRS